MSEFRRDLVDLLPRLRRFATALTGSKADAEDVVQNAVEKALRSQDKFRPGTRMDSWMFKIVHNLWIDETRARRQRHVPLDDALDIAGEDGRETVRNRRRAGAAQAALAALPPDQRAVVALVLLDGASYKDAAQVLNVPVGTIMSRLARARAALVAKIESGEPDLEGMPS